MGEGGRRKGQGPLQKLGQEVWEASTSLTGYHLPTCSPAGGLCGAEGPDDHPLQHAARAPGDCHDGALYSATGECGVLHHPVRVGRGVRGERINTSHIRDRI